MSPRECPAAYVAEMLKGTRLRAKHAYGVILTQPAELEPDERDTPLWVVWVSMAAVLAAAGIWYAILSNIDRPPAVDPAGGAADEATAHGSGSTPREPSSAACLLCWLDGFSGQEARR